MMMKREEIIAAIETLCAGNAGEEDDLALMNRLIEELPNSDISDLIFWDARDLTPEQIVDEAIRRESHYARRINKR